MLNLQSNVLAFVDNESRPGGVALEKQERDMVPTTIAIQQVMSMINRSNLTRKSNDIAVRRSTCLVYL